MQGGKALRSLAVTPVEMTKLSTAKAVQSQPSGQTTGPIPGHQWEIKSFSRSRALSPVLTWGVGALCERERVLGSALTHVAACPHGCGGVFS